MLFGLTNLPSEAGSDKEVRFKGVGSGYIIECEGGYYAGGRGGGTAYDSSGNEIRKFKGDAGANHPRNFVDAVHARNRKLLNAEVEIGHQSTAWCNLANIACRVGTPYADKSTRAIGEGFWPWGALVGITREHLARNDVDIDNSDFKCSPVLEFDADKQQFVGEHADDANNYLRREYRRQFEVPAIS
jgi:hypothetical protein